MSDEQSRVKNVKLLTSKSNFNKPRLKHVLFIIYVLLSTAGPRHQNLGQTTLF